MMLSSDREIVFILGMVAVLIAVIEYFKTRKFIKKANTARGIVVRYGGCNNRKIRVVIRFYVEDRMYWFSSQINSKKNYPIGREVSVVYDPNDPYYAYINGIYHLYKFEAFFFIFGIGMSFTAYAGN